MRPPPSPGGIGPSVLADLLALMPLGVARVLDLGCGDGALGAAYLRRNPTCHYVGVVPDPEAAQLARSRLSRVIVADPAALDDAGGTYDLIVLGDPVGQDGDRAAMLNRVRGLMAPDAHLLIHLPHPGNWARLAARRTGPCPDAPSGASQTLDPFLGLLRACGYRPIRLRPCRSGGPQADKAIAALTPAAVTLGEQAAAFRARALISHHIIVAGRAAEPALPVLRLHQVAMAPDMMAARVVEPARLMQARPLVHLTTATRDLRVPQVPAAGGVLVVQRPRWPTTALRQAVFAHLRAQGWTVVIEFDDDPALVARVLGDPSPDIYHNAFADADAVQTSTPTLAARFARWNPEVRVFANGVAELAPPRPTRQGPLRVFYGALNRGDHAVRVAAAMTGLRDVAFTVVHDRRFFDALPTAAKMFRPTLSYDAYLDALSEADVALMPLEGRDGEQGKSDLKWVEAASRGCAAIVSPAVYGTTVRDGETGLIADTPAGFRAALARLADDPGLRARLVKAARDEVAATRMLGPQVVAREAWYRSLIDQRANLRAAALARG